MTAQTTATLSERQQKWRERAKQFAYSRNI
jgi:hypothetical protein